MKRQLVNRPIDRVAIVCVGLVLSLASVSIDAQEITDVRERYIVQPGDTLRDITEQYLGTELLWRENWRLNPQVADPDLLRIGEELLIIVSRTIEAEQAAVSLVVREVDKAIQSGPWQEAIVGDQLGARDGVRTLADSSATLEFNDQTAIRLDQYSQVFLRSRETDVLGVDRGEIEIVEGTAGVVWDPISPNRARTDLTLVSGDATTDLDPSRGKVSVLAGRDDVAGAQLSMFEGRGEVSANGRSVTLSRGLGVAVPAGGVPSDPEPLLAAPATAFPDDGQALDYDNPPLVWKAVQGAATYRVEICGDVDCEEVLFQRQRLATTSVNADPVDAGMRFWRVAAVSGSGIVGYYSEPSRFTVSRDWSDRYAPGVVVVVEGPSLQPSDEMLRIGPESRLAFRTHDDASGGVVVRFAWDGGALEPWTGQAMVIPPDATTLRFMAADRLGQETPVHAVRIRRDEP